jgi:hypothetical protein
MRGGRVEDTSGMDCGDGNCQPLAGLDGFAGGFRFGRHALRVPRRVPYGAERSGLLPSSEFWRQWRFESQCAECFGGDG